MKKRAAVARAIALDPEILVFDEPSAGLDPIVAAGLDELILFLNTVSDQHAGGDAELSSAFRIADRIAMLYHGSLIEVDSKESFQASKNAASGSFSIGFRLLRAESGGAEPFRELAGLPGAENMKTEAKVGIFVIISAAILLGSVYYITQRQMRGVNVPYRTYLKYAAGWSRELTFCSAGSRSAP